jgi:hypothetical protein
VIGDRLREPPEAIRPAAQGPFLRVRNIHLMVVILWRKYSRCVLPCPVCATKTGPPWATAHHRRSAHGAGARASPSGSRPIGAELRELDDQITRELAVVTDKLAEQERRDGRQQ